MTAEQLKASVLQMAIQGQLVEQLDDEPAVEITADTPEDVPFAIPEKWKWVYLGNISTITGGYAFKSTAYTKTGIRVIRISDFDESGFIDNKIVRHPFDSSLSSFVLEEKNILLCMTGGTVGKSLFVKKINEKMVVNQRVATIKVHEFIPEYIYAVIRSPLSQNVIHRCKNSTNDNISMETIKHFLIPLPPLAEQRRIVARLEELLPLIDAYGKAYTSLTRMEQALPQQLRASLLQEAIQGRIVPQLDDEPAVEIAADTPEDVPFAIPEKWQWVELKNLGSIVSGATPKTGNTQYWEPATIPWITPADLGKNNKKTIGYGKRSISQKGLDSCSAVLMPKNSIVYSSRAPIGHIAIAENALCTNQGCKSVIPKESIIEAEYIYYALISLTPSIQRRASGTTFLEISGRKMGETLIPLPPLAEQRRIVARLEELLPHVEAIAGITESVQ